MSAREVRAFLVGWIAGCGFAIVVMLGLVLLG